MTAQPDTTELRTLAEAATPGPWIADVRDDGRAWIDMPGIDDHALALHGFWSEAAFIAAANPTRILALLDENTTLRHQLAAVEAASATAIQASTEDDRRRLIPWLLVEVQDANELDYITAASRLRAALDRLPECACVHETCRGCRQAMRLAVYGAAVLDQPTTQETNHA